MAVEALCHMLEFRTENRKKCMFKDEMSSLTGLNISFSEKNIGSHYLLSQLPNIKEIYDSYNKQQIEAKNLNIFINNIIAYLCCDYHVIKDCSNLHKLTT